MMMRNSTLFIMPSLRWLKFVFFVWLLLLPSSETAAAAASVAGISSHHRRNPSDHHHPRNRHVSSSSLLLRLRQRQPLLQQPTETSSSYATKRRRRVDGGRGRRRRKSFLLSSSRSVSSASSYSALSQHVELSSSFPAVVIRRSRRRRREQQRQQRRGPTDSDTNDELAYLTRTSSASSSSSETVLSAATKTADPLMTSGAGSPGSAGGTNVIPNYNDLTLIGKIVAGTVEIGATVIIEYLTGFVGGYFIGCVTDIPRLLFRPVIQEGSANAANRLFWKEVWGRTTRMHTKSRNWGSSWGGISAAFGGFRVGVRVIRNKEKDDEWNTIFSSMAAGAFFARTDGMNAMIKSAVLYGGLVYLLSGNSPIFMSRGGRNQNRDFDYEEQAIEF